MTEKEKKLKEQFEKLFKEDVLKRTKFRPMDDGMYLGKDFENALADDMKKNDVYYRYKMLEFNDLGKGRTKICKITSSSRLCYLFLSREYDISSKPEIDWTLEDDSFGFKGDNGRTTRAHFDGRFEKNFYECKCEEFFENHEDYLVAHFYKNLLKNEFHLEGEIPEKDDKLFPTLKQFGIEGYDGDIYSLHFDFKQFLTHLLALGQRNKYEFEPVKLTYLWFVPGDFVLDENLEEFHNELWNEFHAIMDSKIIKKYCFSHGISVDLFYTDGVPELDEN